MLDITLNIIVTNINYFLNYINYFLILLYTTITNKT